MPEILPVAWQPGAALSADSTAVLQHACDILRGGGLVAIPTETVYGLAAIATDAEAVDRIFAAKGRPATNPLIVHVADVEAAASLVRDWPSMATAATKNHWPGPLTVILPASAAVPANVRAGGPTVALRCPQHPVTAGLLRLLGQPLAAPSGNRSGLISPTTAAHVAASLGDAVDLILDGGTCDCGIESTVIDLTTEPPQVLRPGPIDRGTLASSLGCDVQGPGSSNPVARSPGLLLRHYAPRAELELTTTAIPRVEQRLLEGQRVGWITRGGQPADLFQDAVDRGRLHQQPLPDDPAGYARGLYAALHHLDDLNVDAIVAEQPPAREDWQAVHDRLTRAAHRE